MLVDFFWTFKVEFKNCEKYREKQIRDVELEATAVGRELMVLRKFAA